MIKDKRVAFALFTVVFVVLWNLLDFLWAVLVTGNGYHFSAGMDLAAPLDPALVIGYLLFLRDKSE